MPHNGLLNILDHSLNHIDGISNGCLMEGSVLRHTIIIMLFYTYKDFEVLYNLISSETLPPNAADDIHLKVHTYR